MSGLHSSSWILLKLKKETWVLDFHDCVDVLKSRLHDCQLGFNCVVSVCDLLSNHVLWTRFKVAAQKLNELVLHVLDEVQSCGSVSLHDEHSEEGMGFLDAAVEHLDENVWIVRVLNHELLSILYLLKSSLFKVVWVMEEHVVLRAKLNSHLIWSGILSQNEDLHFDRFQSANLLRTSVSILDSELKWNFSVIDDSVAVAFC